MRMMKMNDTATVRERLRTITGTFKASDFSDIKASHAIITKMVLKGEVILVSNIRPKVYKVGKLKSHAPRSAPKAVSIRRAKDETEPLYVQLWRQVWPEFFRVPDFSGYRSTVRGNGLEI